MSLYCVWQISPEQIVLELGHEGEVLRTWKTPGPQCSFGTPKGGTQPLPFEGGFLRFVHVQQINKKSDLFWNYHLACVVCESKPPFQILKMSKQPILTGNEGYTPNCSHWKPRICIPYGAIEKDGGWLVTIGQNDCDCAAVFLTQADLKL